MSGSTDDFISTFHDRPKLSLLVFSNIRIFRLVRNQVKSSIRVIGFSIEVADLKCPLSILYLCSFHFNVFTFPEVVADPLD